MTLADLVVCLVAVAFWVAAVLNTAELIERWIERR
jgi:hypothetical protein